MGRAQTQNLRAQPEGSAAVRARVGRPVDGGRLSWAQSVCARNTELQRTVWNVRWWWPELKTSLHDQRLARDWTAASGLVKRRRPIRTELARSHPNRCSCLARCCVPPRASRRWPVPRTHPNTAKPRWLGDAVSFASGSPANRTACPRLFARKVSLWKHIIGRRRASASFFLHCSLFLRQ